MIFSTEDWLFSLNFILPHSVTSATLEGNITLSDAIVTISLPEQ